MISNPHWTPFFDKQDKGRLTLQDFVLRGASLKQLPAEADTCTNVLFDEPWWLDAVAPGGWDEVTVSQGGKVIARLPYFPERSRRGIVVLSQPPLTQTLGPCVKTSSQKETTRLSEEKELIGSLISQLPRCDLFSQNCAPNVTNVLPFYWNGFALSVHYTYCINCDGQTGVVWDGLTKECRNTVRKAQKSVTVVTDGLTIERFYDVISQTWARQGQSPPFPREILFRLDEACTKRMARRMLHAEDAEGNIHAVAYLVWDRRRAYYLLGGAYPRLRSSGAQSLLVWEAISFAQQVSDAFDFEGSMNERIEPFFRGFGAHQQLLLHISRMSRRMSAITAVKSLFQTIRRTK